MSRALFLSSLNIILIAGCAVFTSNKFADVDPAKDIELVPVFGNHQVLQQQMEIPVWGTAKPGGKVTVKLHNQEKTTLVQPDGTWQVNLDPMNAGGPYELAVVGENTIRLSNVMIGEVYVCSGQSNMEWSLSKAVNAEQEIENADYPNIRLFRVQRNISKVPIDSIITDGWQVCSPKTAAEFSAVGYFFGRYLQRELSVPVGLIHTSWGGTPAEAWTSTEALKTLPDFSVMIAELEKNAATEEEMVRQYEKAVAEWEVQIEKWKESLEQSDPGLHGDRKKWYDPDLDDADWNTMEVPKLWESAGIAGFDGVMWFRKHVDIPDSWQEKDLTIKLGPIDDIDITWFNGDKIGSTEEYDAPRNYGIPASIVTTGSNVIAVRVLDHGGGGGFWGASTQMVLSNNNGDSLLLAGDWKYHLAADGGEIPERPVSPIRPHHRPGVLYNAMIHPLLPYRIRGAIWYQGESNASRAYQYRSLFKTMIMDWREKWGQGDFPFFFVQLANFHAVNETPVESDWAELREAQTMALALPNTGMAVIIDIGEADDIHPRNKQDVGKRLALNALAKVYGRNIVCSGPLYKSHKVENGKIRILFEHVGSGLSAKDGNRLKGFTIADADKKFHRADAVIDGNTVVVSGPEVEQPLAVRYAWADNPVCNLYNAEGLPASPFRTDNWRGITVPPDVQ